MGQNFAGYPEFTVTAKKGDRIHLSFAEILDSDGNFYTENYRSAKAELTYICRDGKQTYKPHLTFYGYRYLRIDEFPTEIQAEQFAGIAIYSEMERTGNIVTANPKLNRLFANTLWSQRSNFVDIPTDCPQRDERLGWTGDAQVFCKAASYHYQVEAFFQKWMEDVRDAQRPDGSIPDTIPNVINHGGSSTAWGDAVCVIPWQMYLMYGNRQILEENWDAMKKWVDFITADTADPYLWTRPEGETGHKHYGDWLALDAPYGSYKGSTDEERIASAFYAYSTSLLVRAGEVLGKDVASYRELHEKILQRMRERYPVSKTQTDYVLDLVFGIAEEKEKASAELAQMIQKNGNRLQTGFVGTPYLLYALSEHGQISTAYRLLLQEEYPSWLYEVNHGATTIWEHWDGIRDDGKLWSKDMNSYNHYAYGSVMDWVYSVAAGICPDEKDPGFERAIIAPHPDAELGWLDCTLKTTHGTIRSAWYVEGDLVRYEIETPVETDIVLGGVARTVCRGSYIFTEAL